MGGGFLIELAQHGSLLLDVQRRAFRVARQVPSTEDISTMSLLR